MECNSQDPGQERHPCEHDLGIQVLKEERLKVASHVDV